MALNREEGFSSGGPTIRDFPTGGVPLLNGFYFQYVNSDHNVAARLDRHVLQVLVNPGFPGPGKIQLGMHEEGSDTHYFFNVRHHVVTDNRIQVFTRALDVGAGREAKVTVTKPPGDMVFVLLGFQLAFHGVDHHLDEAGIFESEGVVTARFNDKNDDDTFKFSLKYCYAPRALFQASGLLRGQNDHGAVRRSIPAGNAVVRGFNMNFRSKDHHIRDIGALLGGGVADVFFEDTNGDDAYDWSLAWATLAQA